jgi:hypothetical protein
MSSGTRSGVRGQRHTLAVLYPRKRPGTHCTRGWMGLRAGLDGYGKNLAPTGIWSPDRPARSQSFYRLSYPGPPPPPPRPWRSIHKVPRCHLLSKRYTVSRYVLKGNSKHCNKISTTFPAPTFTHLTNAQQHHLQHHLHVSYALNFTQKINTTGTHTNSSTLLNKAWFHRTDFHENQNHSLHSCENILYWTVMNISCTELLWTYTVPNCYDHILYRTVMNIFCTEIFPNRRGKN